MKKIFTLLTILTLIMTGSSLAETKGSLQPRNVNNSIINNSTIDGTVIGGTTPAVGSFTDLDASGEVNFTGDRIQVERIHIGYPNLDGTMCSPDWTFACGDHNDAWAYIISEEGSTTARNALVNAWFGDTASGNNYSARSTYDRARGTAGAPTFAQDGDQIYLELFGQWAGKTWGLDNFSKNFQVKLIAEVEEAPFTTCDTTDNEIDTTSAHGMSDDDVIQIYSDTTNISVGGAEIGATNTYYADVIDADSISLCDTVVSGGSCPSEKNITACGSGTRKIISDDGGARMEFYSTQKGSNHTQSLVMTITDNKTIKLHGLNPANYMELSSDNTQAVIATAGNVSSLDIREGLIADSVQSDSYFVGSITESDITTNDAVVYTVGNIANKIIRRGSGDELDAARTDVTPSAEALEVIFISCVNQNSFEFWVMNEDSTHTITVDGGVGVTTVPNDATIPANSTGHFMYVVTSCASNTGNLYSLGNSAQN